MGIKCKQCGESLERQNEKSVGICTYCGSTMNISQTEYTHRTALHDRAATLYDRILEEEKKDEAALSNENSPDSLMKRGFIHLAYGDWIRADESLEKALDLDPKNGRAWLGKLMIETGIRNEGDLVGYRGAISENINYQTALRFGDEELRTFLIRCRHEIEQRTENGRKLKAYNEAMAYGVQKDYRTAAVLFKKLGSFENAEQLSLECEKLARQRAEQRADLLLRWIFILLLILLLVIFYGTYFV